MRGDVIIVEDHHRRAASAIVDHLLDTVRGRDRRSVLAVAGESGSGKSETAQALAEAFAAQGISSAIFQQDDYFVLPPKSNDAKRRQDISWVGPQEVRLHLLDANLVTGLGGADTVDKPLVLYEEDQVIEESMPLIGASVLIAEGTYTTLLEHVDTRIFIARNRLETMAARGRRAREAPNRFIEEVLKIEHDIISQHRARADIVITRDYEVEFPAR